MRVNIEIPDDVYRKAEEAARQQNVSVDEVLQSAIIEYLGVWEALRSRAARGDAGKFRAVMSRVPDIEPDPDDIH